MALDKREAQVGISSLALLLVTFLAMSSTIRTELAIVVFIGVLSANGAFEYFWSRGRRRKE